MLTCKYLRGILGYSQKTGNFVWLKGRRAGQIAGTTTNCGPNKRHKRWIIHIGGTRYYASRLAWLYMTGEWPKHEIDHINGDTLNNRWRNLRQATRSQNTANRPAQANSALQVKGVFLNHGKYLARIQINGKKVFLGRFSTLRAAREAYDQAARLYFGKFAK